MCLHSVSSNCHKPKAHGLGYKVFLRVKEIRRVEWRYELARGKQLSTVSSLVVVAKEILILR